MTRYSIQALKNRITDRIYENHQRTIDGIALQELLHDMIDSLAGVSGGAPAETSCEKIDYGLDGLLNGVNKTFSTSVHYEIGTTKIFLNGVRQTLGEDYTEEGEGVILFTTAPFTGDIITADYQY